MRKSQVREVIAEHYREVGRKGGKATSAKKRASGVANLKKARAVLARQRAAAKKPKRGAS